MPDKIAEIRETIETCFDPEEKVITLNLCDALEKAKKIIYFLSAGKLDAERFYEEIDQILERGK